MDRIFDVTRMKNHKGDNHLLVITEPGVEDVAIGTVLIVPYAEGFKDPVKVRLLTDETGLPKRANSVFGIVTEYIYE